MKVLTETLAALANPKRLQLLEWLKHPKRHFPPQVDGDLVQDGVCAVLIAKKWRVTQPTASRHLKLLVDAGFLRAKRIKQWTFYRRNERSIGEAKRRIGTFLG